MHSLQKIYKLQIYTDSEKLQINYVIYQKPSNCYYSAEGFSFKIPRCDDYQIGQKIRIIGRIPSDSDNKILSQKELIISSIEVIGVIENSVLTWLHKIFFALTLLKNKLLWKLKKLWLEPEFSLIVGMVLGQQERLPEQIMQKIKITGMQHVVVASGFNVSLVGAMILSLLAVFRVKKGWQLLVAVPGILFYCLFSGITAPLTRAIIMFCLSKISSMWLLRQYRVLYALGITFFLMLCFNPFYLLSISFQLTMAATVGIICFYPWFSKGGGQIYAWNLQASTEQIDNFQQNIFFDSLVTTLAAQVLVLPLLIYHFAEFSLVSLVSNTFLLFLTPAITILGFLTILISLAKLILPIASLEWVFALITQELAKFFLWGNIFFGQFESLFFKF